MNNNFKSDVVFTKYQFPAFGELVTLETLLKKLNDAEKFVDDDLIVVFYGWWPKGVDEDKYDKLPKLPKPIESYIPEIGGTLFLHTPSFRDFLAGGNMELLRITENTFVVINVNKF